MQQSSGTSRCITVFPVNNFMVDITAKLNELDGKRNPVYVLVGKKSTKKQLFLQKIFRTVNYLVLIFHRFRTLVIKVKIKFGFADKI